MAYQPKSYRKFVATAATATLVASAVTPAFAAPTQAAAFTDVSARYTEAVDYVVSNNIALGVSDTKFGVADSIKRVDAAVMIAKALELLDEEAPASGFTDVPDRAAVAVNSLKEAGIINGKTATSFGSGDTLTRGEMALILAKAYKLTGDVEELEFTDVSDRYDEAVAALVANDITQGKTATQFGTGDALKRGEFAIFLYKAETLTELTVSGVEVATVNAVTTVSATVKNAESDADAVVEIFANGDTTQAPAATKTVKVGDGTVSADFSDLPAGTHLAKVTVGEVSSTKEFTVEAANPTDIQSVTATNGTITVKFAGDLPTTPTAADFKVARSINGATAVEVAPTVVFNGDTDTATLTVPTVAQTDTNQNVTYSVQYKDTPSKTASFTIAAPAKAAVVTSAGSENGNTVYVYFSEPVDAATATNVGNYRVDTDRTTDNNALLVPTEVKLNTSAVGPYGANQIATLTFAGAPAPLATVTEGRVQVANVKSNNVTIPTTTVNFDAIATNDAIAPTFSAPVVLSNGLTFNNSLTASTGTDVTVQASATDVDNFIAGGQFRVVNSNNSVVQDWTSLSAANAPFDTTAESLTGKFSTANLGTGTYTVQVRALDAAGNLSDTTEPNSTATLTIVPANADVTAPVVTTAAGNYSNVAVTGTDAQGARTVRVEGTATDTATLAGATGGVARVEYRVRQYNTTTGAYNVSTNWTTATAADGSFGGSSEGFEFVTPALQLGGSYLVETRAVDNAGNVGSIVPVTTTGSGAGATSTTPGQQPPLTNTFTVANDTTIPTFTAPLSEAVGFNLGTTSAPSNERNIELTATVQDTNAVTGVEFAVYRVNGTGGRELVRNFSSAGVVVDSDGFNDATPTTETIDIEYQLPNTSGTYEVEAVALDAAGNRSAASTVTHVLDVTAPTATITPNTATTNNTYDYIVTFSEEVTPVDGTLSSNDFAVRNGLGTLTALSDLGSVVATGTTPNQYVLNIAAGDQALITANNTLTIGQDVPGDADITDLAGNNATGSYIIKSSDFE